MMPQANNKTDIAKKEKDYAEFAIPGFFLIFSIYLFIESFSYSQSARLFPLITGGTTMVGSIYLLVRASNLNILERLEITSIFGGADEDDNRRMVDDIEDTESSEENRRKRLFVIAATVGYAILSFLIGMLWASPIFALVYSLWTKQQWYVTIILTILGFAITYGFIAVTNVPLYEGNLVTI